MGLRIKQPFQFMFLTETKLIRTNSQLYMQCFEIFVRGVLKIFKFFLGPGFHDSMDIIFYFAVNTAKLLDANKIPVMDVVRLTNLH